MKDKFVIAVDLGGTNLKLAILDNQYKIKEKKVLTTSEFTSRQELIAAIINAVRDIIQPRTLIKKGISGVGLGVPGPVDNKKGIVYFLPNIPGWKNIRLGEILKDSLGLPVYIDNDANLFTLGEFYLGAGCGMRNIIGITLGTGVGGGLILGGLLYRGGGYLAGEIGHMPIEIQGRPCNCGGKGCLEAYVGNQQILARAAKLFKRKISLEELSILASSGNQKAIRIWQDIGYLLGVALSGVVNLLNLDGIVIGGGVAKAGKVLFESIRKTIRLRAMSVQAKQVEILKSKLGDNAGLIGAGILVNKKGNI